VTDRDIKMPFLDNQGHTNGKHIVCKPEEEPRSKTSKKGKTVMVNLC
jgi:hypothetical protein